VQLKVYDFWEMKLQFWLMKKNPQESKMYDL